MRFEIIKNTYIWFAFSGVLSALSLIFLLVPGFGLPLGIDFTGGTELTVSFHNESPGKETVTEIFASTVGEDRGVKVLQETGKNTFFLRSRVVTPAEQNSLLQAFEQSNFTPTLDSVSTVGPTLGEYFKKQAFWAIAITIIVIILFVAWAFRKVPQGISSWKFGISAIVALVHDVLIIAGFFALLGSFLDIEVDTLFVTALLTVLGFSVHDTIVVFDRLRENIRGKKAKDLAASAEIALWQTMGRSIHTSVSTLLVLGAVLLYGAGSIFAFVLALAFGILIGTYSSIFLAVPLLVKWQQK